MKKLKKTKATLTLLHGMVEDGCPQIADESVDVAVFSPPYKTQDGYTPRLMRRLGALLQRVMKPGGRVYLNFGQLKEGLCRPLHAQRLLLRAAVKRAEETGGIPFVEHQTIIWAKSFFFEGKTRGHVQPINEKSDILNYDYEFIFTYVKHKKGKGAYKTDRLGIGVPYTHKGNLTRDNRGKNGDIRCAGDLWFIPYETVQSSEEKGHRHEFPVEVARRCIVHSGIPPGSTVFDPFMGGGSTALAGRLCKMNIIGNDADKFALKKIQRRWDAREIQKIELVEKV